jgi:hypothetical protein
MRRSRARWPRVVGSVLCGALVLGACSVETSTSSDPGDESHLDDGPGDLLRGADAATDAIAAIEQEVGASPARVRDVLVYPEFLDVEAQDPALPEHIDEYTYRDGDIEPAEAVLLTGPQEEVEASLFPTTAVDWSDLPAIVKRVERAARDAEPLRIEEARVSYVIARRSTSSEDDGRVELTAYINGPRRSGSAELTATGEILVLNVS